MDQSEKLAKKGWILLISSYIVATLNLVVINTNDTLSTISITTLGYISTIIVIACSFISNGYFLKLRKVRSTTSNTIGFWLSLISFLWFLAPLGILLFYKILGII